MAVDNKGATDLANKVGALPTKSRAGRRRGSVHALLRGRVGASAGAAADSIVPVEGGAAVDVQLQAAFAGKVTALQAMQNIDEALKTLDPDLVAPQTKLQRRPRSPEWLWGLLYVMPALALVVMFVGYPFGSILFHAFTRWDGIARARWVGLHNFRVLWHDPLFLHSLRNNGTFALSVPIQVVLPLLVAYVIHGRCPGWRFFRSTIFLPAVYATVVIGILTATVLQLDGPLNQALGSVGLGSPGARVARELQQLTAGDPHRPRLDRLGYNVLLYLAGISAIDPSLENSRGSREPGGCASSSR